MYKAIRKPKSNYSSRVRPQQKLIGIVIPSRSHCSQQIAVLTRIHVSVGGEEDAQTRLVVDRHAGSVVAAHVDAVCKLEGARLRVEHVCRGRVHVARHQLEVNL
ncbi:hypothetical protein E2C01_008352 [Portunus trituberculatus]|uniref:Uncharacterized protein n=1 Tax=Portunus trituberculatus TaxID=210409 RepID=A0A5B7D4G4_PORTR|nr:hypothetical protein [Portunus trituberculatus]